MTRLQRIENAGYKVIAYMNSNGCEARKGLSKVSGTSITDIHKKLFGY